MTTPDQPSPNVPKLNTPEQRIAFMKSVGVPEGFYLVSAPELHAIEQGTSKLNGQIRNWQVLSQAIFGVLHPEEALEVAKRQKIHRKGIMDDRMRYRAALMNILRIATDEGYLDVKDIARDAINAVKQ